MRPLACTGEPWKWKNDPGAARQRHSVGQSVVLPDRAGGPALHFFPSWIKRRGQQRAGAEVTVEGPPLEGHPVIYESAVPCAPSGMFQAVIVKRMQKVISLSLVKNCGTRRSDKGMWVPESENVPTEKDRVFCCKEVHRTEFSHVLQERKRK